MTDILVECEDGVYRVSLEPDGEGEVVDFAAGVVLPPRPRPGELVPGFALSQLVDLDACGATVALLLDRRPPLLVSHDAAHTWTERGAGLPPGRALAFGESPDDLVFGARNRLYVSSSGGVFWRSLAVELPEIRGIAWG